MADIVNIVNYVPNLEICKKLKEAGFPQKTLISWCEYSGKPAIYFHGMILFNMGFSDVVYPSKYQARSMIKFAAPLASEILEKLLNNYALSKCGGINLNNDWTVFNCDDIEESETMNTNPATACALMWLKLREEKVK